MTTSVALCLLAVTIISTLVLAHPLLVMSVVLVLALVFVNLLGNIILWDLDLNTISMINLVMAVGLVVEALTHRVVQDVHSRVLRAVCLALSRSQA